MSRNEINWFHPGLTRESAEKLIINECSEDGAFLIRECNSAAGDFVLTLLHQNKVCHYQIRRHGGDAFFSIDDKVKILHGLESLVEFYQMGANGLPTKLTTFVEKDLPPNDTRRHGNSNLLHRATKENNATIVCELLKCGYRNVDAKNQFGQTALHLACIYSDLTVLDLILATEVNVNCMDAFGYMPLHYACRSKTGLFIRRLITARANVQGRNIKNGFVPLHEASKHGNLEAVKELLECNAPLLPRTSSGEFPIDLARDSSQAAVVNFLSEYKLPPPKTEKSLWYHGTLTREEAVERLQRYERRVFKHKEGQLEAMIDLNQVNEEFKDVNAIDSSGCFLVRYSDRSGYVLTVLFEGRAKNFKISQLSKYLFIDEGPYLPTLEHLVQHFMHFNDGLPTNLKYPVPPEPKPPQPLLSTLPRNKCKNKILHTSKNCTNLIDTTKTLGYEMNTCTLNQNMPRKMSDKKRKEAKNLVVSNVLNIKSKVSISPNGKILTSNMEIEKSKHMLEEFPCKGLSFSTNLVNSGTESIDTNNIASNNSSRTSFIDSQSKVTHDLYNIPKNNTALFKGDEDNVKTCFLLTKYNDDSQYRYNNNNDSQYPGSNINKPICDPREHAIAYLDNKNKDDIGFSEWCHSYDPTLLKEGGSLNIFKDVVANYFISYKNIKLGKIIGEGEFGSVFRGQLKGLEEKCFENNFEIAIKTLRDEQCHTGKLDFLREASVMFRLKHHCIVQLIGISKEKTLMMIQELVPLGSMLNFIQNNRTKIEPNRELKLWASQIACGKKK